MPNLHKWDPKEVAKVMENLREAAHQAAVVRDRLAMQRNTFGPARAKEFHELHLEILRLMERIS